MVQRCYYANASAAGGEPSGSPPQTPCYRADNLVLNLLLQGQYVEAEELCRQAEPVATELFEKSTTSPQP